MKVRVAYIEEPPFYWTGADGRPTGSDIELAGVVLRAIGATSIEYQKTSFGELLTGVQERRWDMNVPIFVTDERSKLVTFSSPVWALADGFLVTKGNPEKLASYKAIAARGDLKLGLVVSTVQIDAAKAAGVKESQIVAFEDQPAAVSALKARSINAYAATAVGNRALAAEDDEVEAVESEPVPGIAVPVGGYSFHKNNHGLINAFNEELRGYLGSEDHRRRMSKYGIQAGEIDSVLQH